MRQRFFSIALAVAGSLAAVSGSRTYFAEAAEPTAKTSPVDRARREVKMLDDIYKTSIVLITTHYVDDKHSLPAGAAFRALLTPSRTRDGMKSVYSMPPATPTSLETNRRRL